MAKKFFKSKENYEKSREKSKTRARIHAARERARRKVERAKILESLKPEIEKLQKKLHEEERFKHKLYGDYLRAELDRLTIRSDEI
ncbi:MAG: hypothetical protein ACREBU_10900 [Nitrososphaera sp.]